MFQELNVTVYRFSLGDCTNNGISSRHNTLTCFDGDLDEIKEYVEEKNIDMDRCLYVVRRELWGKPEPYLTPLKWAIKKPTSGPVMAGGNYAKGDSRWKEWFGHYLPLPIHDRIETWEEYDALSR